MSVSTRFRGRLRLPITWGVIFLTLNVTLTVVWIVLLVQNYLGGALVIGSVAFVLALVAISVYMFLTIKAVRLNQRQANFVDSVTHELKSPLASLKLYLETLQLRALDDARRREFYEVMHSELRRLDTLISHLLEVGRLDAIGHETFPEEVDLEELLRRSADAACAGHKCQPDDVFTWDLEPAVVRSRRMVLEMIFGNLMDNAIKYGGRPPRVDVQVRLKDRRRVLVRIRDNGHGVPPELRKKIFRIFFRGGNELERRQKGTGLGLYIVKTLVQVLRGKVAVTDRGDSPGSQFEVELPGRLAA